jgi:hypothetical protein
MARLCAFAEQTTLPLHARGFQMWAMTALLE